MGPRDIGRISTKTCLWREVIQESTKIRKPRKGALAGQRETARKQCSSHAPQVLAGWGEGRCAASLCATGGLVSWGEAARKPLLPPTPAKQGSNVTFMLFD